VWAQPGHADGSVTVHLGYGRTKGGRSANGRRLQSVRPAHRLKRCGRIPASTAKKIGRILPDSRTTQNEHALDPKRHIIQKAISRSI
jgi:hypothetical protein